MYRSKPDEKRKMMAEQILVALRNHDRLSRMVPYIEEIASPGMKVILLIPFDLRTASDAFRTESVALKRLNQERTLGQIDGATDTTANIKGAHIVEEEDRRAEHKVFLALERLLKKGIDISVNVYTGSLRSAVKSYTARGNVHVIMRRAGRALMMLQFFCRSVPNFVLLKRPSLSPIRMLRANQTV
jgi:hypothetical protein